jgi:hypothetical protein
MVSRLLVNPNVLLSPMARADVEAFLRMEYGKEVLGHYVCLA